MVRKPLAPLLSLLCAFVPLCLCAFPTAASAAWDDASWPTWTNQFNGRHVGRQVYSGLVERCTVTGETEPSSLTGWFMQRSRLKSYKATAKALIPQFVDLSQTNAAGTFDDYFVAHSNTVRFPLLTVTGLCDQLRLPTNYFEYTPWFHLNGYGSATNDPTVGHPHGPSNATTAAGGTFFPPDRTSSNWWTTDYGWAPMQMIVNTLVATEKQTDYPDVVYGLQNTFSAYSNDWTGLRQAAIDWYGDTNANWATTNYAGGLDQHFYRVWIVFGTNACGPASDTYRISIASKSQNVRGDWSISGIATQYASTVHAYMHAEPFSFDYWGADTLDPEVNFSFTNLPAASANTRTIPYPTRNLAESIPADPLNIAVSNATCIPPPNRLQDQTDKDWWLLRWDVTGGFSYVP